jgi:hypothetical protein
MNSKELHLIKELFRIKNQKSKYINVQNYQDAAIARDLERDIEKELLLISDVNYKEDELESQSLRKQKIYEYFESKFEVEYPTNLLSSSEKIKYDSFVKTLIRDEKLNNLGI